MAEWVLSVSLPLPSPGLIADGDRSRSLPPPGGGTGLVVPVAPAGLLLPLLVLLLLLADVFAVAFADGLMVGFVVGLVLVFVDDLTGVVVLCREEEEPAGDNLPSPCACASLDSSSPSNFTLFSSPCIAPPPTPIPSPPPPAINSPAGDILSNTSSLASTATGGLYLGRVKNMGRYRRGRATG